METEAKYGAAATGQHGQVRPWVEALSRAPHGLMHLLRLALRLRARFEELQVELANALRTCLIKGHSWTSLSTEPSWRREGGARTAASALATTCSGEAVHGRTRHHVTVAVFAGVGGRVAQIVHRGQPVRRVPHDNLEHLDGVFLPLLVPIGWRAVACQDETIVHDGLAVDTIRISRESLDLLRSPVCASTLEARYAFRIA